MTLPAGLFVVGVTGGIGSGKSLVCDELMRLGIPVLSADTIAKELSATDPQLRRSLSTILGVDAYLPDGSYNRAYVASRIFADGTLKGRVEAAIHPRVERQLGVRLRALRKEGRRVAAVEAALIYEAGYDRWLSGVLVVDANQPLRIERLRARGGLSDDEIRRRMAGQMDPAAAAERADFLIRNNGTPGELRARVRFFAAMFHTLSMAPRT